MGRGKKGDREAKKRKNVKERYRMEGQRGGRSKGAKGKEERANGKEMDGRKGR